MNLTAFPSRYMTASSKWQHRVFIALWTWMVVVVLGTLRREAGSQLKNIEWIISWKWELKKMFVFKTSGLIQETQII